MTPRRLVFLGMQCEFTRLALQALLAAGCPVVALIIPSPSGREAQTNPPPALPVIADDPVSVAHAHRIPVVEVGRLRSPAALAALEALRPDLICVACFPRRLPEPWLALPALGGLNLHPSLLPAYRGPEPLFWQFRHGAARTGVTVHRLAAQLDAGDIVAQAAVPFPDGLSGLEAERLTGQAGGALLAECVRSAEWQTRPQDEAQASYYPRPTARDLVIPSDWPARRAFNFMRGAEAWGPFTVVGPASAVSVRSALAYTTGDPHRADPPEAVRADERWIAFAPGAVKVRVAGRT